jgi:hypothetical protein
MEHCNKLVVNGLFREAFDSQKQDNPPLFHLVHSGDLKFIDILGHCFNVFFQEFVV